MVSTSSFHPLHLYYIICIQLLPYSPNPTPNAKQNLRKNLPPLLDHIRIHHHRTYPYHESAHTPCQKSEDQKLTRHIKPQTEIKDGRHRCAGRRRRGAVHEPPFARDADGVEDDEEGVSIAQDELRPTAHHPREQRRRKRREGKYLNHLTAPLSAPDPDSSPTKYTYRTASALDHASSMQA